MIHNITNTGDQTSLIVMLMLSVSSNRDPPWSRTVAASETTAPAYRGEVCSGPKQPP